MYSVYKINVSHQGHFIFEKNLDALLSAIDVNMLKHFDAIEVNLNDNDGDVTEKE